MNVIRKVVGNILRTVFPAQWIRILRNPALLPGYYKKIAREIEYVQDIKERQKSFDDEYWAALLRKYAHILDKGLQRSDFEPGHSQDVYQDAKDTLDRIKHEALKNDPSLTWAKGKIQEYEAMQSGQRFPLKKSVENGDLLFPQLMSLIKSRRSVRSYLEKPVEMQTIHKVIEAANWAPASCNRQTIKVFASIEPSLAKKCMATCKGATCFGEFTPCFLAFCADLRPYVLPHEFSLPIIDVSLGVQNCCLIAHSLDLSLTLLSWSHKTDSEEKKLRSLLEIPDHYMIIVNGVMGYPAYKADTPLRKSFDVNCIIR